MCLDLISAKITASNRTRFAYKVFYQKREGAPLHSTHWSVRGKDIDYSRSIVPIDRWFRATLVKLTCKCYPRDKYPAGFHVYRTLKDARHGRRSGIFNWDARRVIVRVKVRQVRIAGQEGDCDVLIADEMFVPKDAKIWTK